MVKIKPLIGITGCIVYDWEQGNQRLRGMPGQDMLMVSHDYLNCVQHVGGIPVPLPALDAKEYPKDVAERLDGLILTGGPDVNPYLYKQGSRIGLGKLSPQRDSFEMAVLKEMLAQDKPILGICRGAQLLNVFFGGTLYQDLKNEGVAAQIEHAGKATRVKYNYIHKVSFKEGSSFREIYDAQEVWVNSLHHQAVEKLGVDLVCDGHSEDGIIEAFHHKEYGFVLGVQWHPEMMAEVHSEHYGVFRALVNKAISKKLRG